MPRSFLIKKAEVSKKQDFWRNGHRRKVECPSVYGQLALSPFTPLLPFSHPALCPQPDQENPATGHENETDLPTSQASVQAPNDFLSSASGDLTPSESVTPGEHSEDEDNSSLSGSVSDYTAAGTVDYTVEAFLVSDGRRQRKRKDDAETGSEDELGKYVCCECGKQYATSSNLSRHKQTHRSLDSQQAKKCPHCHKVYVSMPALSMHILTHNLKHECKSCGKTFSRPWLLQGHMRSHTGEKPYGCAHCGKAFADRSNLRAHMQTHSSLKHYQCLKCNKNFALKSYLSKHIESSCIKP